MVGNPLPVQGQAPSSVRIRSTVLAPTPTCATPPAAPASSTAHFSTCANPSVEILAAYPPSSAALGPALLQLSTASPGPTFAPPFSAGSRPAHVGISS